NRRRRPGHRHRHPTAAPPAHPPARPDQRPYLRGHLPPPWRPGLRLHLRLGGSPRMSSDSVPLRPAMTRDAAATLLGQTMGLVAVTAGLFAVGAFAAA